VNFTAADQKFFFNPFVLGFVALVLAFAFRQLMLRPLKKTRPLPPLASLDLPSGEKLQLSSPWGPYLKFIVPFGWALAFTLGGIAYFMGFLNPRNFPPNLLFFLGLGIFILFFQGIFMARVGWQLKKVEFDNKYLYISDSSRTIPVPINSIGEISEYHWLKHERAVKITYKTPTEFGDSTLFLLKKKSIYGVREDLLDQLRSLANDKK